MDLKELLGEELHKQVTEKVGEHKIAVVSDGNWFPKEKFNQVNTDNKDLKKQLKDRDTQLEELKKVDAEGLQQKIQELQQANDQASKDYEMKLSEQAFNYALKDALVGAKAKNPKAVEALLKKDAIKLDGDKLLGLEEQLNSLKESDSYLFDQEQQQPPNPNPTFSPGQHIPPGGSNEPSTLAEALAQHFSIPQ